MGFFSSPANRAKEPKRERMSRVVEEFKGRESESLEDFLLRTDDARSNLCPYCRKRTDVGACVNSKCDAYSGKPKRWQRFL